MKDKKIVEKQIGLDVCGADAEERGGYIRVEKQAGRAGL